MASLGSWREPAWDSWRTAQLLILSRLTQHVQTHPQHLSVICTPAPQHVAQTSCVQSTAGSIEGSVILGHSTLCSDVSVSAVML